MQQISIISLKWENIYLKITFNETIEKELYLVDSKNNKKLIFDDYINGNELKLPITCAYQDSMIEEGAWSFLYDDKKINILSSEAKLIDNKSKVFFYKKNSYAYVVSFSIDDEFNLVINTTYMKRNFKPSDNKVITKNKFNIHNSFNFVVKILFFFLNLEYKLLSVIHKKRGNKILFMSETRDRLEGNLLALKNRICERNLDKEYKLYFSFRKVLKERKSILYYVKVISLFAKVDYIFIDDYAPTFSFINLKETKLIQLWHAGVGFKSVGYSRFGKNGSPHPLISPHRKYDYVVVASENLIPVYQEVFGLSRKHFIAPGMLRLDGYLDEERINNGKRKIYSLYPSIINKKVILFAPTYRGAGQESAYYDYDKLDLDKLYNVSKENNYIVLFKFHPFIREKINIPSEYNDNFIDASEYTDINELFYVTDILITDYSSNIYEYSLFEKPIIFFNYDMDEYAILRGVHVDLEESPGNVCRTFDELIEVLKSKKFNIERVKKFKHDNIAYQDSGACDRLIKVLLNK